MLVYSIHAYRWGDRDCHSYQVGVSSDKETALKIADEAEEYRGGKYECEVIAFDTEVKSYGEDFNWDVIKPLPVIQYDSVDQIKFRHERYMYDMLNKGEKLE